MRLDLRDIIHVPDAQKSFQLQVDLSELEFYGRKPVTRPVLAEGRVTNHAGALVLEGTARPLLDLVCDRCGKPFPVKRRSSWTACWPRSWRMRKATRSSCWKTASWT